MTPIQYRNATTPGQSSLDKDCWLVLGPFKKGCMQISRPLGQKGATELGLGPTNLGNHKEAGRMESSTRAADGTSPLFAG